MNHMGQVISLRLMLVLLLVTAIVIGLFIAARFHIEVQKFEQQLEQKSEHIANRVASSVRPSIWNIYQKGINRQISEDITTAILNGEFIAPEVSAIRVYGNFGHLFMGRIRLGTGDIVRYSESLHHHLISTATVVRRKPIKYENITIGNVEVLLNEPQWKQGPKYKLAVELVQFTAVVIFIILLIYVVLEYSLTKSLREFQVAKRVLGSLTEGVLVLDSQFRVLDVNTKFSALTGFKLKSTLHCVFPLHELIDTELSNVGVIIEQLQEENRWSGDVRIKRRDGKTFPARLEGSCVLSKSRKIEAYVLVFRDTTHLESKRIELEHMAFHDPLTGLPNRANFERTLAQRIAMAERGFNQLGLFYIDLDDFKAVNDTLGHEAGDTLLLEVTKRFKSRLRDTDTLSRIGGDEFTLILPASDGHKDFLQLGEELIKLASQPLIIGTKKIYVGASIGVAIYPRDGRSVSELLKHADSAMYRAKEHGRGRVNFYSQELDHQSEQRAIFENDLLNALATKEFLLYFQPLFTLEPRKVIGFEALLRWNKHQQEIIKPEMIIPFALERGLMIPIGRWVLSEAIQQLYEWKKAGFNIENISVNLTSPEFYDSNLIPYLKIVLKEKKINPRYLTIEITETCLFENINVASTVLDKLKSLGFSIALDDFGFGFTSLHHLQILPIDQIKIHNSFVSKIEHSEQAKAIVHAIIDLAKHFDIEVFAEGLEHESIIKTLIKMGCKCGQGYVLARPQTPQEASSWLSHQSNISTFPLSGNNKHSSD